MPGVTIAKEIELEDQDPWLHFASAKVGKVGSSSDRVSLPL